MAPRTTQTDTGIDPQIAELLGLDFTADLDREDYLSLLKEKMISNQMVDGKGDNDELGKLVKRVKKDNYTDT